MQRKIVILCALMSLLLAGCVNLVEKGGRVIDGSAFKEKMSARYRGNSGFEIREMKNRAGEGSIIILMDQFPAVKLRGSAPDSQGNFRLNSLEFLEGTLSGWNEFTLDISAEGSFVHGPDGSGVLTLKSPLDAVGISAGKIRRSDNRLTGTEALTSLRNRYDRIQALVEWMKEQDGVNVAAPMDQKSFEAYWRPLLLPELVRAKKRPPAWKEATAPRAYRGADASWVRAEDIRWNVNYTEALFPETLRPLRNSGALLRDWEEASGWIYLEYNRDRIEGALQNEINVKRQKK